MMGLKLRFGIMAIGFGASLGCSTDWGQAPLTSLLEHDLTRLDDREQALVSFGEGVATDNSDPIDDLANETVTVEEYVRLALVRNPSIKAAEQRVRRIRERAPQVSSLDDPRLAITPIGELSETAAGQVQTLTSVSQKLPFPGKLSTRKSIVLQEAAIAAQDLERRRLQVVADTRRAYWSFYFTTRAIETTTRLRNLLAQLERVAEAKFRAGTATQPDVLRASVELGNLEIELVDLEQRRLSASSEINSLIDRSVIRPLPTPAPVDVSQFDLKVADLIDQALEQSPVIRKIHEQIELFRQKRKLAQLDRRPDLTVSVNYNFVNDGGLSPVATGDNQWAVGFSVNLPIWADRLSAAEREATRGVLESIGELSAAQRRVAFLVRDAMARVESQQKQAVLFRDQIVPEARETVESSFSGYRAGAVDFQTLIDNWRRQLDFEILYDQMVSQLEQSFADLRQAVGADVRRDASSLPDEAGIKLETTTLQSEASS